MTTALSDLSAVQTKDQIRQRILVALQTAGIPVTDWAPTERGGIESANVDMVATGLVHQSATQVALGIAGRFLDLATGDWLKMLAKRFHRLDAQPATRTVQRITLTSSVAGSPLNKQPGEMWVVSDSGNRYSNLDPVVLKTGATGSFLFQAENPGASYADSANTISTLAASLPGVTAVNQRTFDIVELTAGGTSSGSVIPVQTPAQKVSGRTLVDPNVPLTAERFRVQIVASGQSGTAQFVGSIDDGKTWTPAAVCSSVAATVIGGGASVLFADGPITSPSFKKGDVFFWSASPIATQGSDAESDEALRIRCRSRWPALSDVPTAGTIELLAKMVSQEITRVRVLSDPNRGGGMLVYLGSASGRASMRTVSAVAGLLAQWSDVGENANVATVDTRTITASGNVQVPRANLLAARAAASVAWTAYLGRIRIGGTVRLAVLEQVIKDAGATDYQSVMLNGSAANLTLATSEVPVEDSTTLATALSWEPI